MTQTFPRKARETGLIRLHVNGAERSAPATPRTLLSDFLRHKLGLTGTRVGCEQGACGSCAVSLDGELVLSCLVFAAQAHGSTVETIEGLGTPSRLHPIQAAFQKEHGLQCGFCTPGIVMAAKALLDSNIDPSDAEIRRYLGGNICRCTGYVGIINAVRRAARVLRDERPAPAETDAP